jgi:hypothetical protein
LNNKAWYKSKTIWFNVLAAMGAALEASLSVIQGEINQNAYLALVVIVAGGNVILRFISTQGIGK